MACVSYVEFMVARMPSHDRRPTHLQRPSKRSGGKSTKMSVSQCCQDDFATKMMKKMGADALEACGILWFIFRSSHVETCLDSLAI